MSQVELAPSTIHRPPTVPRRGAEAILRIPLRMHVAARQCSAPQPVTVGVPLPRGAISGQFATAVEIGTGQRTFCQHEVLGHWPDGSAKWLLADFVARASDSAPLKLLLSRAGGRLESGGVEVHKTADGWCVIAGLNRFELGPGRDFLFRMHDPRGGSNDQTTSAYFTLTDSRGRIRRPNIREVVPETVGPVRATFVCRGTIPRCRGLRFECRVCVFAAGGYVRIRPTLHNPNRARHRGGLWDLGDPGSILFNDFSLHVSLPQSASRETRFRTCRGTPLQTAGGGEVEIYQDSSGGTNWRSRNHVNRDGRVPCRIPGYRVRTAGSEIFGRRAEPLVVLRDVSRQFEMALPECWQQFPKAVQADRRGLQIHLFPAEWDDLFELQGGERKTHTIWISAMPRAPGDVCRLDWAHAPALVTSTAQWYQRCGVWEAFPVDVASDHAYLRECTSAALAEDRGLATRREQIDEYGWRNFGDLWADHEEAHYDGPKPVISHYNNQYDVLEGAIRHWVRSGDPGWWRIADPLARHILDIDLYHTDADRPAFNHGMFWHTDHYRDAAWCGHRTYSRKNAAGKPYGGGPSASHVYSTGLLQYYYLTGDRTSRDAVIRLAEWLIQMEDGRLTELGILDSGPTGHSSQSAPGFHGPGRGPANAVSTLLDAWELTADRRYLTQAEELIRRVIHPDDDFSSLELLDVERRWSYSMFLLSLCKYLDAKIVADERDDMYAYGVASARHYAQWMLDNERPYFEVPEQLEFPTETWGAQDVRKANAMRRLARYCDERLARELSERSAAIADRGWEDTFRFPSRHTLRATAILLIEGLRDAYFRGRSEPAAPPASRVRFPAAAPFQDQRERIGLSLASPLGALKVAARLLKAHRWPATWRALSRRLG